MFDLLATGGLRVGCREVDTQLLRGLGDNCVARPTGRNKPRAGGPRVHAVLKRRRDAIRFHIRFRETIGNRRGVVYFRAHKITRLAFRNHASRHCCYAGHVDERTRHRIERTIKLHAHLIRQCPSRIVIRRDGRAARIGKIVGMILRFEHVEHVCTECLSRLNHPGVGGIRFAVCLERRRRALHLHTGLLECLHKLCGRWKIGLRARNDVRACIAIFRLLEQRHVAIVRNGASGRGARTTATSTGIFGARSGGTILLNLCRHCGNPLRADRPVVVHARLNGVVAHTPAIHQELFTIFRREIEQRAIGRDGVIDRLTEMPLLRRDWKRKAGRTQLTVRHERHTHWCWAANRFGQDADHVVEVRRRPQSAVPPRRIIRSCAKRQAWLVLQNETVIERGTNKIESRDNRGVKIIVGRIAIRRCSHNRARRAGLVMVVHDLRMPFDEHLTRHVGGLLQRVHEGVTIVIVARVLVVQTRNCAESPFQFVGLFHVPIGDLLHAVRICVYNEDDTVVENPFRLIIGEARELPKNFD